VNGGITLGYLMIGFALIDVIAIQLIVRSRPSDTDDRRLANRMIVIASILTAVGLCAVAIFAPIGQMQII
jgi:hypothetical protein